jgi:hypothetical protein
MPAALPVRRLAPPWHAVRSGAAIPVLLMLPNVAWVLIPAPDALSRDAAPLALTIAENVSRVVVLALPCFHSVDRKRKHSAVALVGMAAALAVYYAAWGRYFVGGGAAELLSAPLAGIPSPLAFAPVALLAISSYVIASSWMLGAAVCFGALHVWASALTR